MQYDIILYIIIFLYGTVFGSFLNVLIYRLPLKENIATEHSHCMTCGKKIQWYDLVPLVSYIILGGKCRHCKAKISIQYPIIEATNGLAYVCIFLIKGFSLVTVLMCFAFSVFLVISVIDCRTMEIPFALNVSIGVLAVLRLILEYIEYRDLRVLLEYIIGFFVVSGFMYICLMIGRTLKGIDAFGGGDIKLMAFAGLFIGWKSVILAFFIGCILAAVIHTIRMKVSKEGHVLAFGPYLCAGLTIAMLYGSEIINWYVSLFSI
jgi:leader peptidase (prepilin peptidase)/N-methyltransferase